MLKTCQNVTVSCKRKCKGENRYEKKTTVGVAGHNERQRMPEILQWLKEQLVTVA